MFCLKCFHSWRYICYVFTFGLASISTCLHDYLHYVDYIYILVFCPLQHSLIAMSSCWIFWTKWMWSDPNLSTLSISNSTSPNHMHSIETVECLHCVLVSWRYRDNHKVRFKCPFTHIKSREAGTTARQSRRAWDVEQTPNFRKLATRSSDANRQGHLCNSTVPPLCL